jgi:ribokinase
LIVNEHEANELGFFLGLESQTLEALARQLRLLVGQCVVITRGERGAIAISPDFELLNMGAEAINVIDSTGAGDAFVGTFCALWAAQNHEFKAILKASIAAGGRACTRVGAI